MTPSQRSPDASDRSTRICQQPACGKLKPVPTSSPGRFQVDPPCTSGPHRSGIGWPAASETRKAKLPDPVILHTTFTSLPADGGIVLKKSAHRLPRLELSPVSGIPALLNVAAGRHPGVPRLPRKPPVGAIGETVARDEAGGEPQAMASSNASPRLTADLATPSVHLISTQGSVETSALRRFNRCHSTIVWRRSSAGGSVWTGRDRGSTETG
jgi:hypothetical protein